MNRLSLIAILFALVLFGGCKDDSRLRPRSAAPENQSEDINASASLVVTNITPGNFGGVLKIPLVGEPRTFNPLIAHDRASEAIARLLFAGLTRFNWQTETPEPDLALKWSVAEDGRTWTWHLRPGLQWSDGQALTADDVVFTWNDIIYNEHFINPLAQTFSIDGAKFTVSEVDPLTVRFVTPKPFAPFVEFVGSMPVLPRHSLRGYVNERRFTEFLGLGTPAFRFVGSGPYQINRYVPGALVALDRNPYYHRVDEGGNRLPYIDQIEFGSVPTPDDLPHRFLTDEFALAEGFRPEDLPALNEAVKTNAHQSIDLGPGGHSRVLWFNQNAKAAGVAPHKLAWFRETAFRRAVTLALDRDAIIRKATDGKGGLARGFIVAESRRWLTDKTLAFPHDAAAALKELATIGIKKAGDGRLRDRDGNPVTFTLKLARGSASGTTVGETIREQLDALGMRVSIEHVEFPALLDSMETKFDYDAIVMGFGGGMPDPQTSGDILRSDGPMHFWNPRPTEPAAWEREIDKLFIRQRGEMDFQQRRQTCDEIRLILARELPFIPLFVRHNHAALRGHLGNLKASSTAPFPLTWNLEELFRQ